MYDYSKLRGRIVEKFGSQRNFSEKIDLSERTIGLKLNNLISFNQSDIETWSTHLEITRDEIPDYFFTKKVQKF